MPATRIPATREQRRAHYDDFVTQVITLCKVNGIRADLATGRGRPVSECDRLDEHLIRHAAGFGARRAHYTVASLIAMQRDLFKEDGPYRPEHPGPADTAPPPADSGPAAPPPAPAGSATEAGAGGAGGTGLEAAARAWRTRPDLGTSLALAVTRHGFDETRFTRHLKTLTRLSTDLLHPQLWRLTSRLHDRGAARLDFAVLLDDLARWDHDPQQVAARWRTSYFTTLHIHTIAEQEDDN